MGHVALRLPFDLGSNGVRGTRLTPFILCVDDDSQLRKFLLRGLSRAGFNVAEAENGAAGIALLKERPFDAVVCDLHMPGSDGLDVLRFAQTLTPPPAFVVMTGYGSVSVAVEAMKQGASDFLEKPVSIEELRATLQSVLRKKENSEPTEVPEHESLLVGSPRWLEPFQTSLARIAATDSTVLIDGETGTGKSAVAKEIWRLSNRAAGPFVELNCAAIPEHLLESELFGHTRGSFTGATSTHVGKVEIAAGGTLFLDEVGELKPELQAKLLHLLQERTFTPIGATRAKTADVRFIAATNRSLLEEVERGNFRLDLFHRLNVVSITIPPLRDRPDDIPTLIEHFRRSVGKRIQVAPPHFSDEAIAMLSLYSWPGNVRELENLVERMAVMHPSTTLIQPEHFGDRIKHVIDAQSAVVRRSEAIEFSTFEIPHTADLPPLDGRSLTDAVRSYEIKLIRRALENAQGNKSLAARMLNMKRTTLLEKLKKLGIESTLPESEAISDERDNL